MFSALLQIIRTDIDDGTPYTFGRGDDDIVVFGHLEGVQGAFGTGFGRGFVEDSFIDRFGYGIVDKLGKDQTV